MSVDAASVLRKLVDDMLLALAEQNHGATQVSLSAGCVMILSADATQSDNHAMRDMLPLCLDMAWLICSCHQQPQCLECAQLQCGCHQLFSPCLLMPVSADDVLIASAAAGPQD